jgi:hypothetical protein
MREVGRTSEMTVARKIFGARLAHTLEDWSRSVMIAGRGGGAISAVLVGQVAAHRAAGQTQNWLFCAYCSLLEFSA